MAFMEERVHKIISWFKVQVINQNSKRKVSDYTKLIKKKVASYTMFKGEVAIYHYESRFIIMNRDSCWDSFPK
jgi:hypothetical protein